MNGRPLPQSLIIMPGIYRVHGCSYDLAKEGLYRFFYPGVENQQRIVYRSDPWSFVSALSWLSSHGNRDNGKSVAAKIKIVMREKLIVTCGDMAAFGAHLLAQHGFQTRRVGSRTLATLNNYDTGHSLAEVKLNGQWVLMDLDVKFFFRHGHRRLTLLEAVEAVGADDYQLEPLAQAVGIAVSNFKDKEGYDYGLWMETLFSNQSGIRNWYRRIMMIPIIYAQGRAFFTTQTKHQLQKARRLWKDLTYLPRADFIKHFYAD
ncbi:MAG: hypothetical protein ABIH24_02125 [Verrucomicrobiota bacterium]